MKHIEAALDNDEMSAEDACKLVMEKIPEHITPLTNVLQTARADMKLAIQTCAKHSIMLGKLETDDDQYKVTRGYLLMAVGTFAAAEAICSDADDQKPDRLAAAKASLSKQKACTVHPKILALINV